MPSVLNFSHSLPCRQLHSCHGPNVIIQRWEYHTSPELPYTYCIPTRRCCQIVRHSNILCHWVFGGEQVRNFGHAISNNACLSQALIWDIIIHLPQDFKLATQHKINFPFIVYCISRYSSLNKLSIQSDQCCRLSCLAYLLAFVVVSSTFVSPL